MEYRIGPDILEDNPVILLDRLEIAGALALQADISAISARVFNYANLEDAKADVLGTEVGTAISFVVATSIFDTLQTGGMWPTAKDSRGYNCKLTIPAARFPSGSLFFRVEVKITRTAAGEDPFYLPPWIFKALATASS